MWKELTNEMLQLKLICEIEARQDQAGNMASMQKKRNPTFRRFCAIKAMDIKMIEYNSLKGSKIFME